jgi:hypothetical protein
MSLVSTTRALPDPDDDHEKQYLLTPGMIINSSWNQESQQYDAPVLTGCPPPVSDCPASTNCEVRIHPLELETPEPCSGMFPEPTLYYLPSLGLVMKNNVTGNEQIVSLQTAYDAIGEDPPKSSETTITCENGTERTVSFEQDGILSAIYTISLYNSYQDSAKKTIYEYVVCPYAPVDVFQLTNPCVDPSAPNLLKEIMGTQPFCLGSVEQPCVCVSLLLHGSLEEASPDCFGTSLAWVGVKLYYTNIQGQMCHSNPVCMNITHAPDSAFIDCYTPYFAKTVPLPPPEPSSVVSPPCGQTTDRNCPTPLNVQPGESLQGKVYLGCGIEGSAPSDKPLANRIIEVSQKVDVSDILSDDCSVYVVLIPKLQTLTA